MRLVFALVLTVITLATACAPTIADDRGMAGLPTAVAPIETHTPAPTATRSPTVATVTSVPTQTNTPKPATTSTPSTGIVNGSANAEPLTVRGLEVYRKLYCGTCHTLDAAGTAGMFGPPHDGIGETAVRRIQSPDYTGTAATAREYLIESIVNPDVYIVGGYAHTYHRMPAYTHVSAGELEALVETAASLEPERAFGLLVNEILDSLPEPFALIIDDLHALTDTALCASLDYFIANLPPQMRLLATARHDPPLALSLLRSRAQLAEIRPPDLRLTRKEAARLLESGLKLDLPEDVLLAIHNSSEGWVTGLRLLAGYFGDGRAIEDDVSLGAGLGEQHVFDLLAAEVLNKQGEAIRSFWTETNF